MKKPISIVGAGIAGSECALQLADRGFNVELFEMRPVKKTEVHETDSCAELVCSNSLKSMKPESAAGMLKAELEALGSRLYALARKNAVPAGGALAVDRAAFARDVTEAIESHPGISLVRGEVTGVAELCRESSAVILATGPLTSEALSGELADLAGQEHLAFFDAAAPIVAADSLDGSVLFRQSRYEDEQVEGGLPRGDYLNAPFTKAEYERFIEELLAAERVIAKEFETKELFQACQPIEEIARSGFDAPRFGPLKPVGLTDPRTGRRPWAVLQLRAENVARSAYNLVGFQTNLKFSEQKRVFRMVPGLERAEFSRFGVMHRNTFLDAPKVLDSALRMTTAPAAVLGSPLYVAGQLAGTEGYCEAIRSGLHAALSVASDLRGIEAVPLPEQTVFGALLRYATDPETTNYQPMHVNFGILPPLDPPVRNKGMRYSAYAARGEAALQAYRSELCRRGLLGGK